MKLINEQTFKGSFKGKTIELFTLKNKNGLVAQVTNFGAKIVALWAPDKNGVFADVVTGYETADEWIKGNPYFGATCGRVANRIAFGKFTIDGIEYQLPINNGPNSLHGGPEGFNNQVFDAGKVISENGTQSVEMTYLCKDGEMGYPGNMVFKITFTLTDDNEFILDYFATCDKATPINIASHSFFNIAGEGSGSAMEHELMINASQFTPTDATNIPTGELWDVEGTPMDFRTPQIVGSRISDDYEQLTFGKGYDHNWVLDKGEDELGLAAIYSDPKSGRTMEIYTTQPGVQLYTSNWLDGSDIGKSGAYHERTSLCLETQHFPDSVNKPHFPSTILRPGEEFQHSVVHKFTVK